MERCTPRSKSCARGSDGQRQIMTEEYAQESGHQEALRTGRKEEEQRRDREQGRLSMSKFSIMHHDYYYFYYSHIIINNHINHHHIFPVRYYRMISSINIQQSNYRIIRQSQYQIFSLSNNLIIITEEQKRKSRSITAAPAPILHNSLR